MRLPPSCMTMSATTFELRTFPKAQSSAPPANSPGMISRRSSTSALAIGRPPRRQTYQSCRPLVVTITNNDQNVPRIPKTRDIMMSSRKPLTTMSLGDLGLDEAELQTNASGVEVVDLFVPVKDTTCEFAEGESLDEKVNWFAEQLAEIIRAV